MKVFSVDIRKMDTCWNVDNSILFSLRIWRRRNQLCNQTQVVTAQQKLVLQYINIFAICIQCSRKLKAEFVSTVAICSRVLFIVAIYCILDMENRKSLLQRFLSAKFQFQLYNGPTETLLPPPNVSIHNNMEGFDSQTKTASPFTINWPPLQPGGSQGLWTMFIFSYSLAPVHSFHLQFNI